MKQIILLSIIGTLTAGGWAWARQQEMLDHPGQIRLQEMQDASCPPSSSIPPGQ
jgi:hypothetical protein